MGKRLTNEEFKTRADAVHNNYYDYSKTEYTNSRNTVTITCPKHGDFEQLAQNHLKGKKCYECGQEDLKEYRTSTKKTTEQFIEQALKVHGPSYDYSKTVYTNAKSKVTITCPIHGDFEILPSNHLVGAQGCKNCTPKGYSDSEWATRGELSKHFDSFKLYIVKCYHEDEVFYKIGKTFTTLERRFAGLPYSWEKVMTIVDTPKSISELERKLHKQNAEHCYTPQKHFSGNTECFISIN